MCDLNWNWVFDASWKTPTKRDGTEKHRENTLGEIAAGAVACAECQAVVPESRLALLTAKRETVEPLGSFPCPSCGKPITVRPAPSENWCTILGEEPGWILGSASTQPNAPTESMCFNCPACSAPLSADGSSRTPTCQYCSKRIMLPDAVWNALHPPLKVVPFYLWLDERKIATRTARVRKKAFLYLAILWTMMTPGLLVASWGRVLYPLGIGLLFVSAIWAHIRVRRAIRLENDDRP
jgi:DNA-directed RNA polymerase subunit RPC12/RpoP